MTSIVIFWINLSYHWVGKFCQCCPVSTSSDFPPQYRFSQRLFCAVSGRESSLLAGRTAADSSMEQNSKHLSLYWLFVIIHLNIVCLLVCTLLVTQTKAVRCMRQKNYVAKTTQPVFSVDSCWFYQTIRFLVIPPSTNYTLTGHFIRYTYSTAW